MDCPCGSNKNYSECCGPFIDNHKKPELPEQLMRSRYTAYTQTNIAYIVKTMRQPALGKFDKGYAEDTKQIKWLGLQILKTSNDKIKGYVEFIAHFEHQNNKDFIHEVSEFHKINNEWFYVDGISNKAKPYIKTQLGRNDLCHCGSGKKYKKCCMF